MKTREEMSISQIFNRMENLNLSSGRTLETNTRPISAAVKRPDSRSKINHSYFNNNNNNVGVSNNNYRNNNFASVITEMNNKKINYSTSKPKIKNNINLEKERLYEDIIHLKNTINELKKEISNLKSENHKFSLELNKKDKMLEEMLIDSQNNMFNNNPLNESKVLNKAKETHLFIQIKKQFKELKNEYKSKCIELDSVKKNVKLTKFNEIGIELKTYMEELARIKSLYFVVSQQNEINEKKLKDFDGLHQNFTQQQYILVTMQENINKYENELKLKNEEINDLKNSNMEKSNKIKKLTAELKILNEINQKISKDKKIVNDFNALKTKLEKQISDLNKEIFYYKDLADKRDKRLRDLESTLKSLNDKNKKENGPSIHFNIESIRNIQENPEDKTDRTILFLRSKLNESNSSNEKLQKRIKLLEEKLNQYENQYEVQDNYNQNDYMETNGFFSLNEFSYILIKNFEAKKIDGNIAINTFFEKINSKREKITLNEVIEILFNNFISILNIKNESDVIKIEDYLKNLLSSVNNEWNMMEKKMIEMLSSIKIYSESEEKNYKKKLSKFLRKNQNFFVSSIEKCDPNKKGLISFMNLRKILENVNLNLEENYIEYLIYLMKSFNDENTCLDDLKYGIIFDLINQKKKKTESDKSSDSEGESQRGEGDESEIVITSEQFRLRLKTIFSKLNDYLKKHNTTVREFFRGQIFRPTFEDPPMECHEDAIFLKPFVELLKTIHIEMDTIDMYCVYTRLKIIDNSEAISVNYLEYELKNLENSNEILESNATSQNNFMVNNDINSKSVDVKIGEIPINNNSIHNKIVNNYKSNANNIKISIDNDENTSENKNVNHQIGLIETDSEKESLEESEGSESKSESGSSNENKENYYKNKRKEEILQNMEEKYSKNVSEKVNEVDEKDEDSYADYAFDKAVEYSNESESNLSNRVKKIVSKDNEEIEDFITRKKSKKIENSGDERTENSKMSRPMSAIYKSSDQKN